MYIGTKTTFENQIETKNLYPLTKYYLIYKWYIFKMYKF